MIDRREFWQDKKVFITGHTGFKGSWLSLWLQGLGADLVGYALEPPTRPSLFEVAAVSNGMRSIHGDVRDLAHLTAAMADHRPDVVFHLAAQSLVRYSYKDPIETISTNVLGTAHLLESVRHTESVQTVVCITSDKCYENNEWPWGYREVDRLGGHDPYSASKACAEMVIATFRRSYFSPETGRRLAVASTRAGNVIGGGDWAKDRLVPDIMRAMMTGEPVVIRNPLATRPWQHVLEPLNGYLALAEQMWPHNQKLAQPWNFGPRDEDVKPVAWIADYVTRRWGEGACWQLDGSEQPHENTYLKLDCSKARQELKWSPRLDLATALDWIVAWFRAYGNGEEMRVVTQAQIQSFMGIVTA